MAKDKRSFIAYSDWKETFDALPDEDAGKLIKHIFAYVNDEHPVSDSVLINAVFANIRSTLKRDLQRWSDQLHQRSEAGKRSAEIRSTKINDRSTTVKTRQRKATDSVNVSVSDNGNEIKSNNGIITHPSKIQINFDEYDSKILDAWAKFQIWINENCPTVQKLKDPITISNFSDNFDKYNSQLGVDTLLSMQNHKLLLKKYTSANLTFLKWFKKDQEKQPLSKWDQNKQSSDEAKILLGHV